MTFIISKRGSEVRLFLTFVNGRPHWTSTKEWAAVYTRWSRVPPLIKRALRQDKKNYRVIIQTGK